MVIEKRFSTLFMVNRCLYLVFLLGTSFLLEKYWFIILLWLGSRKIIRTLTLPMLILRGPSGPQEGIPNLQHWSSVTLHFREYISLFLYVSNFPKKCFYCTVNRVGTYLLKIRMFFLSRFSWDVTEAAHQGRSFSQPEHLCDLPAVL